MEPSGQILHQQPAGPAEHPSAPRAGGSRDPAPSPAEGGDDGSDTGQRAGDRSQRTGLIRAQLGY